MNIFVKAKNNITKFVKDHKIEIITNVGMVVGMAIGAAGTAYIYHSSVIPNERKLHALYGSSCACTAIEDHYMAAHGCDRAQAMADLGIVTYDPSRGRVA